MTNENFYNKLLRVVIEKAVKLKRALIEIKSDTHFGMDSYRLIYKMKISYFFKLSIDVLNCMNFGNFKFSVYVKISSLIH